MRDNRQFRACRYPLIETIIKMNRLTAVQELQRIRQAVWSILGKHAAALNNLRPFVKTEEVRTAEGAEMVFAVW